MRVMKHGRDVSGALLSSTSDHVAITTAERVRGAETLKLVTMMEEEL